MRRFAFLSFPILGFSDPCLEADLPANAFEIATTCALLDTVNVNVPLSVAGTLACVSQFAHGGGSYGEEMYDLFDSDSGSACAIAILAYESRVITNRSSFACGEISTETTPWTSDELPASLTSHACLLVLSSSLEYFNYVNNFDIRVDLVFGAACGSIPTSAFEIVTTNILFDLISIPTYIDITPANMLTSIDRFVHGMSEYAYDLHILFSGNCATALLQYARKLIGERPATACGPAPEGVSGLVLTDIPDGLTSTDCLMLLAPSLEFFSNLNMVDLRGANICPASAITAFEGTYYTLEVMKVCVKDLRSTFSTCLQEEDTDMSTAFVAIAIGCSPCYNDLYASLVSAGFGIAVCTGADVYSQNCLAAIGTYISTFTMCTGGSTLGVTGHVCSDTDLLIESVYQPIAGMFTKLAIEEYQEYYYGLFVLFGSMAEMPAIMDAVCGECYQQLDVEISPTANRQARLQAMCGAPNYDALIMPRLPTYDMIVGGCKSFLLEAGSPLSEFQKCTKFPMTFPDAFADSPHCDSNMEVASIFAYIPIIECLVTDYFFTQQSLTEYLDITNEDSCIRKLGVDLDALPSSCLACHMRLLMGIYDTITRNIGSIFTCFTNPYDIACLYSLYSPLVSYLYCTDYNYSVTDMSQETCVVPRDGSQAKFDLAVDLAFNMVMVENEDYSDFIADPRYPFTSEPPCHRCFEGFMNLLQQFTRYEPIWGESLHGCEVTRNSPRCYLEAAKAISMFEACSGLKITRLPELDTLVVASSCEAEWPAAILNAYRYHSALVRMVLNEIALPASLARPNRTSICEECVTQFVSDVELLNTANSLFAVVCSDAYSDSCLEAIDSALVRFNACSGGADLLSGTPNTFSESIFSTLADSGIAKYIVYDIGLRGDPDEFQASYTLETSVLQAALAAEKLTETQVDIIRPCLMDLVKALVKMNPLYRANCSSNFESFECGIRIGSILQQFESCSGGFLTFAPADLNSESVVVGTDTPTTSTSPPSSSSKSGSFLFASMILLISAI